MDRIRLCLCVSLVISCLAQVGMFVPIILDVDLDFDTNPPVKVTDGILEPMDTNDLFILPSRSRRNLAQLLAGTYQYGNSTGGQSSKNPRFPNRHTILNQQTGEIARQ